MKKVKGVLCNGQSSNRPFHSSDLTMNDRVRVILDNRENSKLQSLLLNPKVGNTSTFLLPLEIQSTSSYSLNLVKS